MGNVTNAYKIFDVKPKNKRFFENIKKVIGVKLTGWIGSE
jgi:hypothetical protein